MVPKKSNRIGAAVRTSRRKLGLTQKDLAARARTTEAAVSHIERGLRRPSADMLARLAAALDCSADDLVAGVAQVAKESPYLPRVVNAMKSFPPTVQEQVADYCDFLRQRLKKRG